MAKLSISKAWDDSRPIIVNDGNLMFAVALATVVVPGTLLYMMDPSAADIGSATQVDAESAGDVGTFIVSLVSGLIGLIGSIAISYLALMPGKSVGDALRRGVKRLVPAILAILLLLIPIVLVVMLMAVTTVGVENLVNQTTDELPTMSAGAAFAVIAIVIAAIYVGVRLLPMTPVIAAEDGGPLDILKRAWSLTKGHFWRLFAYLFLFSIGAIIVIGGVGLIANLILALIFGDPEPMSVGALFYGLVSTVLQAAVTVVYSVMVARIYRQLSIEPVASPSVPDVGNE